MVDAKSPPADGGKSSLTADELIQKLRSALQRSGDFPASAKIVGELRQLASDPKASANQVTEVILREPSLGVRVLHLVNSSFYRRAKPIMTVSQAVVQIGMRPLAEMCSGLVLLQKFVPAARRGGSFANCLRRTVVTSLLSSVISPGVAATTATPSKTSKNEEYGYLAGSFAELGTLLLAFYFPQIYDAATKRAEQKHQEVGQSIKDLTGLSPLQLSMEVLDALDLPSFYKEILSESQNLEYKTPIEKTPSQSMKAPASPEAVRLAKTVSAAKLISEVVVSNRSRQDLEKAVSQARERFGVEAPALQKALGELPEIFKNHCAAIDLQLPALPEFVMSYSQDPQAQEGSAPAPDSGNREDDAQFNQFVAEIRQAVENREPTASIITSVMETCAWSLKFDRVFLMLVTPNKGRLVGRMLLGNVSNFDPKRFERVISPDLTRHPEVMAFREARPIYTGDPLIPGGWPIAAIPIGFGQRAIGVIYADRSDSESEELTSREQAAIGILAELLDRSLALQA